MSLVASTKPISRILPFTRTENRTSELFNRYLSVVPADTPSLLDQAFRLRFQVYCVERGFENPTDYPDGRERDRDDDRSLHSLLIDRATCSAVGTVRLILPRGRDELPVFGVIGPRERSVTRLPSETTAEVSRFAVAKSFRRQIEHGWYSHSGSTTIAGRVRTDVTQLLTFGLISGRGHDERVRWDNPHRRDDGADSFAIAWSARHRVSSARRTGRASRHSPARMGSNEAADCKYQKLSS